jgi:hypothetical protein
MYITKSFEIVLIGTTLAVAIPVDIAARTGTVLS